MVYGFSVTGFLFMVLLTAPSLYWAGLPGYARYRSRKKWGYAALERIGLTAMFPIASIFRNYDCRGMEPALVLWVLAWGFLLAYEVHWICCRVKNREPMHLGRLPLTVLPVLAFVLLALYGRAVWLLAAAAVYGVGHVGGMTDTSQRSLDCPCCSEGSCELPK